MSLPSGRGRGRPPGAGDRAVERASGFAFPSAAAITEAGRSITTTGSEASSQPSDSRTSRSALAALSDLRSIRIAACCVERQAQRPSPRSGPRLRSAEAPSARRSPIPVPSPFSRSGARSSASSPSRIAGQSAATGRAHADGVSGGRSRETLRSAWLRKQPQIVEPVLSMPHSSPRLRQPSADGRRDCSHMLAPGANEVRRLRRSSCAVRDVEVVLEPDAHVCRLRGTSTPPPHRTTGRAISLSRPLVLHPSGTFSADVGEVGSGRSGGCRPSPPSRTRSGGGCSSRSHVEQWVRLAMWPSRSASAGLDALLCARPCRGAMIVSTSSRTRP